MKFFAAVTLLLVAALAQVRDHLSMEALHVPVCVMKTLPALPSADEVRGAFVVCAAVGRASHQASSIHPGACFPRPSPPRQLKGSLARMATHQLNQPADVS